MYSLWPAGVTGPGGSQHSPTRRGSGRASPAKEVSVEWGLQVTASPGHLPHLACICDYTHVAPA